MSITRKDILLSVAYVLASMLLFGGAFGAGYYVRGTHIAPTSDRYPLLAEAQQILDQYYLGEIGDQTLVNRELVRGLLLGYEDRYTIYVEPVQAQINSDNLAGVYGGIGSYLIRNEDGVVVLEPFPNSPAEQAGILVGDFLLAVDGLTLTPEMTVEDIATRVRGLEGTRVLLLIQTPGDDPREIEVVRRQIDLPSVTYRLLEDTPNLGYLRLSRFTDRSTDEVSAALEQMLTDGMTGLVLDLRNNGGGLRDSAIELSDLFLDEGVIMYEQRLNQSERVFSATTGDILDGLPIIILVNGNTASASEILAGALQQNDRAILLGQPTFGKGSVQLIHNLSDGSSLHVTNARWLLPNHGGLDGDGLQPDILIEFDAEAHSLGFDPELQQAIELLTTEIQP